MQTSAPRHALLGLLGVAAVLMAAGCSSSAAQGRATVDLQDNFFSREVTRIEVGDAVAWRNTGQALHNAVAVNGAWSVPEQGGADDPDGNGLLEPGEQVTRTYEQSGVYEYYCTLHGTPDGEGMFAVLVVGDVDYDAAGEGAPTEPVREWSGETRNVPDEYPTIQNAVDAAAPGDLVLIGPAPQDEAHLAEDGQYVYFEQVEVTTPYVTLRGTDRRRVIVDGEFQRPNGISIFAADGVAVENLTVRNATENGVFWTGLTGYRASYVTAYNNGVYGIYAFDAVDGLFEHSWASGSPDAGFYIGQCEPCDAVITDVVAEDNALGYSGTNASDLWIVNSVWRHNIVGIAPNTLDTERLPPFERVTIAGNLVHDNDNRDAPSLDIEWPAFGNGILLGGGLDSLVTRNRIVNHARSGVLVTPNLSRNFWMSGGNIVEGNVIEGSGYADLTLAGPALGENCFRDNDVTATIPVALQAFADCRGIELPYGYELASTFSSVGLVAEVELGLKPEHDYRLQGAPDDPIAYEPMPGGADAPVRPAVDVFDPPDLAAIGVPDLPPDLTMDQTKELTVFGVPLAAGAASVFFGLYGYLLPFVLLAAWTALAMWDLVRREDLGRGATAGWVAVVLLVPFVGPIVYHAASRSPIPAWQRGLFVGGGLAAYVVILVVALLVGGVV